MSLLKLAAVIIASAFIAACDIQPVSVGIWDVEIALPGTTQSSVWTISDGPGLTIAGESGSILQIDEIDLSGSRVIWSSDTNNFATAAGGQVERINFRGTVNGSRFAGTLFTQAGNYTVNGTRRE